MKIAVIHFELFLLTLSLVCCLCTATAAGKNKTHWYNHNYQLIRRRLAQLGLKPEHVGRVRNAILFVGDGMGMATVSASRVYKKQKLGNADAKLEFDEFPASALIHTDTANSQISESAAAATALFCGVKTNFESLGVDASAGEKACIDVKSHAPSIVAWAQERKLKTGFVTTTRITHATPAALYAHSRRHMEDDSKSDVACKDIARQLIENEPGRSLHVIMGGGLRSFIGEHNEHGRRKDGRNLTAEWQRAHPRGEFVTNRAQMMAAGANTEHLLAIFNASHMHFNADRDEEEEPSLAEMTMKALEILKTKNANGFLLVVEAGKIDLAHHYNNAFRALDDTLALDEAVKVAVRSVDLSDTLVIVTADHASAMVYSGYATPKDYSVLGMDKYVSNVDKSSYQLLTYSSGLGHENYNETIAKSDHRNSYHKATIPSTWANHGGDDVPLYAIGALSNILFSGSMDQSYVPHAIAFAMCLGGYQNRPYLRHAFEQRIAPSREKVRSNVHIVRDMLKTTATPMKEKQMEAEEPTTVSITEAEVLEEIHEMNVTVIEEILDNFLNNSEVDLASTSDLVQSDDESGKSQIASNFALAVISMMFVLVL